MILRNLLVLFALFMLIGCNQSDTNGKPETTEGAETNTEQSDSTMNDDTAKTDSEPEEEGKILARVNGQPVYEKDLRGRTLDRAIKDEILYQEGVRMGIDKEYRDSIRNYERTLVIRWTKQQILENAEPAREISDEEIANYYEENKLKYSNIKINEISFPDGKIGEEIRDKAKGGEELKDIANSYPDIEITVNDLGYNRNLAQNFEVQEVGSVSEVIEKPNGTFSVLKIVEIKETPLNTSKRGIKEILEARRKAAMFSDYANKIAEENNMAIEIIQQQ